MLLHQRDDGRTHDRPIGETRHLPRLLGGGNAKANGAGNRGILAHHLHDRGQIRRDLTSRARHAQAGHDVEKSLRLPRDPGNAVLRGRRNERNQVHAEAAADRQEFLLFLKGQIRQDEPVDPDLPADGDKPLRPVGEDHVGVSHKHHRRLHIASDVPHKVKDLVGRHASPQRAQVGPLDDRALRGGIGEWNAQLDEVGPVFHGGAHRPARGLQIRIPAREKGNERLSVGKRLLNVTHADPPLCSGQWPRSPCRPCRTP